MVTAKSRRSVRTLFSAILASGSITGAALVTGGCDNPTSKADKTVTQQVQTAESKDVGPDDRKALLAALDTAAADKNASPSVKVNIKLEQARQEIDSADAMARAVGAEETVIGRLAGQVQALTGMISANSRLIEGLTLREPVAALKAVDDAIAAAKGSGDTATWGLPDKGVPAGSAVDAETARIKAEIQKLTDERATLDTQQKQNSDEARKLEDQASKGHGAAARDAGLKAAGLRRDARSAGMRMEQIDRTVSLLQEDQKVQIVRGAALADADKAFQDRKAKIAADWEDIKKQIEAYKDTSKTILQGSGDAADTAAAETQPSPPTPSDTPAAPARSAAGPTTAGSATKPSADDLADGRGEASITQLAQRIAKKLDQCNVDREEAIKRYEVAFGHVKEAREFAEQVVKGLPKQVSEKDAVTSLTDLFGASDFKLQQAAIRLKEAQLRADQADTASVLSDMRTTLSASLEKASLPMPKEFAGLPRPVDLAPAADIAALRKLSDDQYTEANGILEEVGNDATTARARSNQSIAKGMQVAAEFARAQYLYRVAAEEDRKTPPNGGDKTKKAADDLLSNATRAIALLNDSSPIPDTTYLTPVLAAVIRKPVALPPLGSVPTSGPSGAPATPSGVFSPGAPATSPATAPSDTMPPAAPTAPVAGPTPPATPPAAPDAGTTPADFVSHNIGSTGATIKTPGNWQEKQSVLGALLVLGPPEPSGASMSILTQPAPADINTVTASVKAQPGVQVLSSDPITIGPNHGVKIVADATLNNAPLRVEQYYIISGSQMYFLLFTAPADQFPALDPIFAQVANTLQLPAAAPAAPDAGTPATPAAPAAAPAAPDAGTPATPATPAAPATAPAP